MSVPPKVIVGNFSSTVFINGQRVATSSALGLSGLIAGVKKWFTKQFKMFTKPWTFSLTVMTSTFVKEVVNLQALTEQIKIPGLAELKSVDDVFKDIQNQIKQVADVADLVTAIPSMKLDDILKIPGVDLKTLVDIPNIDLSNIKVEDLAQIPGIDFTKISIPGVSFDLTTIEPTFQVVSDANLEQAVEGEVNTAPDPDEVIDIPEAGTIEYDGDLTIKVTGNYKVDVTGAIDLVGEHVDINKDPD
jgi:hypothetical protein